MLFVCGSLYADDTDPLQTAQSQLSENESELAELVKQLGADEFGKRRAAFMQLWAWGEEALPIVEEAKVSGDLHLAESAAALEPLLLAGTSRQEAGADIYDLLFEPGIDDVNTLCQRGLWDLAERVLEANPVLRAEFSGPGRAYLITRFVKSALEQGNPELAWPIMRLILSGSKVGEDTATWISAKLDTDSPATMSNDERALRALYQGEPVEEWTELASSAVRRKILTRSHQYEVLAEPKNVTLLLGNRTGLAYEAARAVLLEFAGEFTQADRIWQQLLTPEGRTLTATAENLDPETAGALKLLEDAPRFDSGQILYSLLLSGRVEPVTNYFREKDPEACSEFLAAGADYSGVFELAGLETDLSNFSDWLRRQTPLIEQEARQAISSGGTFQRLARVCSIMIGLGYTEESKALLKKLVVNADTKTTLWQNSILRWMNQSEQRAMLLEVVEPQLNELGAEVQATILARLFPEFPMTSAELIATAPLVKDAQGQPLSRLTLLEKLHAWDQKFFEERGTSISSWILRARSAIMRQRTNQYGNITPQLAELARLAKGSGFQELAFELAETDLEALGFITPTIQAHRYIAAEILLERGEAKAAANQLHELRTRSLAPDPTLLLQEEKASLLAGQHEEAIQINNARWLAPLLHSRLIRGNTYADVASELIDSNDFSAAREYADAAFMLAPFGGVDIYWTASDLATIYEEDDRFDRSAPPLRAALVEALEPNSGLVSWQINNGNFHFLRYAAQRERLHRAVADIMEGDFDAADRNIAIGEKLQPQDIEMVVQCYPRLRDAGETERATRLFESFQKTMLQQISEWPNDTTALNNLAWMYAKCDRNLEEAYRLSQKAVSLAPNSHIYLDTLAEVHFRAGRYDAAIAAMNGCIRMDPRDLHYRQNLERYRSAKRSAKG